MPQTILFALDGVVEVAGAVEDCCARSGKAVVELLQAVTVSGAELALIEAPAFTARRTRFAWGALGNS